MISEVSSVVVSDWLNLAKSKYRYAGLLTSEPSGFRSVNEATPRTRQVVNWSGTKSSGGLVVNTNELRWTGLDWGQRITHIGLFESAGIESMGFWGELSGPSVIERGFAGDDTDNEIRRMGSGTFVIAKQQLAIRIS